MCNLKVYSSFGRGLAGARPIAPLSRLLQKRLNGHFWLNKFWGVAMHTRHMIFLQQLLRKLVRQGTVDANLQELVLSVHQICANRVI